MRYTVIIPARYDSHRFPGKLLAKLRGKEILAWVYERASASSASAVYIATDDERIAALGKALKAPVVMTAPEHSSGTSRVYEAACQLKLPEEEIIINVQGDEPLLAAANIEQLAAMLQDNPEVDMASLTVPLVNDEELHNPHCVKAVTDRNGLALYFSRSPIPYISSKDKLSSVSAAADAAAPYLWQRHLGIYAYRMGFLAQYTAWEECAYEQQEQLEQLRALYNGAKLLLASASQVPPPGVDTPADLEYLEKLMD